MLVEIALTFTISLTTVSVDSIQDSAGAQTTGQPDTLPAISPPMARNMRA